MYTKEQLIQFRNKIKTMPGYLQYWASRLVSLKVASEIGIECPHIVTGATEQRYIDKVGHMLGIKTYITRALDSDNAGTSRRYGLQVFRAFKLAGDRVAQAGLGKPKLARKLRKRARRFNNPLIKTHNVVVKEVVKEVLPEGFNGSITFR